MDVFIKIGFDILSFSCIMVLIVSGLAIIASLMGIFNLGHGEFVLLGAYTVYVFRELGLPEWMGMACAPFAVGTLGIIIEMILIRRLYTVPIIAMLSTYAIGLIIRETVRGLIGGKYYYVKAPIEGLFQIGDYSFSIWRLVIILSTITIMVLCYLFLTRTTYGLKVRGSMENPLLARASGISTKQLYTLTFGFGAALAGLAGALMVPVFSLSADLGLAFMVQAFLSLMLGGIGTFEGPLLGSALIGGMVPGFQWLREIPFIVDHISPIFSEVFVFIVALVIVKFRPRGLISKGRI
jgi:branched-chain amino acid transport system permease protein